MPKYDYRCTACGRTFDVQQSFTDDPLTVCDECGGALRKLFGSVGVSFKGSGFYRNDHGSTKQPASAGTAPSGGTSSSATPSPSTPTTSTTSSGSSATTSSTSTTTGAA